MKVLLFLAQGFEELRSQCIYRYDWLEQDL